MGVVAGIREYFDGVRESGQIGERHHVAAELVEVRHRGIDRFDEHRRVVIAERGGDLAEQVEDLLLRVGRKRCARRRGASHGQEKSSPSHNQVR